MLTQSLFSLDVNPDHHRSGGMIGMCVYGNVGTPSTVPEAVCVVPFMGSHVGVSALRVSGSDSRSGRVDQSANMHVSICVHH